MNAVIAKQNEIYFALKETETTGTRITRIHWMSA
jgi:hypothetical protein